MTCQYPTSGLNAAAQECEKSMMPSALKCYIVLRATAFLRKDSL
jgi:hypothetical protein